MLVTIINQTKFRGLMIVNYICKNSNVDDFTNDTKR